MNSFKNISPSIFNAFNICPRQAWLMSRNLTADQKNSYIEIGRLIDENSFSKEKKHIYIADLHAVVDMVQKKDGKYFIAEIKKSSRTLKSGILQLKYYLYLLNKKKFFVKGMIKIPSEKKSIIIELKDQDIDFIEEKLEELKVLLNKDKCPKAISLKICPKCGHFEFCWS